MFETGFLGTRAFLYMDIVTLYFILFPFLMAFAIYMAVKKRYRLHHLLQQFLFLLSMLIIVIFEVGSRISGGFSYFIKDSNADYNFMIIFLIVHILIALGSVVAYIFLIYSSTKQYISNKHTVSSNHKKIGKIVYFGMTLTSLMGVMMYYFLFIY